MARRRLYILDGHAAIYRAMYASGPRLTAPDGEPTRGTYFFTSTLCRLARMCQPDYFAVATDPPRHSYFRHKLCDDYKGGRESNFDEGMAQEISQQLSRARDVLEALDVPRLEVFGFEADDVIATIAHRYQSKVDVVICGQDKDLHQLVTDRVSIYDPYKNESYRPKDVEGKWGLPPDKLVDLQTLMGDSVDNIQGVVGIGPKTALNLLRDYGTVGALVEKARQLQAIMDKHGPNSIQAKRAKTRHLSQAKVEAILDADLETARKLVTLRTDVPLKVRLSDLRFSGLDFTKARPLFKKLGFKRLAR